jgi:hypothetical protein
MAPQGIPHYLNKWQDFRKELLNINCVFLCSLQVLSETFLILRRIQRDIVINVELFHADTQTWRQIVSFCSFANAHKNEASYVTDNMKTETANAGSVPANDNDYSVLHLYQYFQAILP